jgi:hypothetical protein
LYLKRFSPLLPLAPDLLSFAGAWYREEPHGTKLCKEHGGGPAARSNSSATPTRPSPNLALSFLGCKGIGGAGKFFTGVRMNPVAATAALCRKCARQKNAGIHGCFPVMAQQAIDNFLKKCYALNVYN